MHQPALPLVSSSSWFHVVNRIERDPSADRPSDPLASEAAKRAFLAALGRMAQTEPVEIHAYCAMESHYHALVRGDESDVSAAFAALDERCGFVSGPPRLRRLALGRHLIQVTRYIHRNPCDAGIVEQPEEWAWSSYRGYLDPNDGPGWLQSRVVLAWLGMGARARYREIVERSGG